jgi:hypothetical protein
LSSPRPADVLPSFGALTLQYTDYTFLQFPLRFLM